MILDITFTSGTYQLVLHKLFLQNTALNIFQQPDTPLIKKYIHLGRFEIQGERFGFDGCWSLLRVEGAYSFYALQVPENNVSKILEKMIATVCLSTWYVVEQMFYQEKGEGDHWSDQSLTFVFGSGAGLGGQLYPWFKKQLRGLDDNRLQELNSYVDEQLVKIQPLLSMSCLGKVPSLYQQMVIQKDSFKLGIDAGGRWLSGLTEEMEECEEFSSHNFDCAYHRQLGFAAIVIMNTWLRQYAGEGK